MKNVFQYKGYAGSVAFDADDKIFHGRVLGIRAIIGFEGTTVEKMKPRALKIIKSTTPG